MASVSNLDQDVKNMRLSRYTPQAANEVRLWIEGVLGEQLPSGDLLDALRDGVALCKLANLVLPPPGVKFKTSSMPFIQMENISHFLTACEMPPLNMPAYDRFLTVDLYEQKDPAQVLQCLGAFSRQAYAAKPDVFRSTLGPKKSAGATTSPMNTGVGAMNGSRDWRGSNNSGRSGSPTKVSSTLPGSTRPMSPSMTGGSTGSHTTDGGPKSPSGPVSSWTKKSDEGSTAPAWNIAQYGYMGGASQGNQGISFGGRRQITNAAPIVPNAGEKERRRAEKAAEDERLRMEAEEAEQKRLLERDAEEEREKVEQERRWEEDTKRFREEERRRLDQQKRQWAEQESKWRDEEDMASRKEQTDLQFKQKKPPEKPRVPSSGILRGQTLSQWQREQTGSPGGSKPAETPEQARVRELEQQLEEARERERQYQSEREEKLRQGTSSRSSTQMETSRPHSARESEASWAGDEREYLRQHWQINQDPAPVKPADAGAQRPLPDPKSPPTAARPLPQPTETEDENDPPPLPQPVQQTDSASSFYPSSESAPRSSPLGSSSRPLPTPDKEYEPFTPGQRQPSANRTERFLSTIPAPPETKPRISSAQETGDTAQEQARDRDRRLASQQKTKAGGWASKSLLEREMERERERQKEWEANQQETKNAPRDPAQGTKEGQSWDVNQYGYTGGDNMNRTSGPGSGIDFGGRRQILGPRGPRPR